MGGGEYSDYRMQIRKMSQWGADILITEYRYGRCLLVIALCGLYLFLLKKKLFFFFSYFLTCQLFLSSPLPKSVFWDPPLQASPRSSSQPHMSPGQRWKRKPNIGLINDNKEEADSTQLKGRGHRSPSQFLLPGVIDWKLHRLFSHFRYQLLCLHPCLLSSSDFLPDFLMVHFHSLSFSLIPFPSTLLPFSKHELKPYPPRQKHHGDKGWSGQRFSFPRSSVCYG